jgi:hypothetical protein
LSSGQACQRRARQLQAWQWLLPSSIPMAWFRVDGGGSGPLLGTGGLIWSRSLGRQQPSPKCRWWLLASLAPEAVKWWDSTSRDG